MITKTRTKAKGRLLLVPLTAGGLLFSCTTTENQTPSEQTSSASESFGNVTTIAENLDAPWSIAFTVRRRC